MFYVSCIDGPRYSLLAGPFKTHAEAEGLVEAARKEACNVDPRAHWYAFGTCRVDDWSKPGVLNGRLGL